MRERRLELFWLLFALVNTVVMFGAGESETIPFHFIWVSFTILYGIRMWRPGSTWVLLGMVCTVSAAALLRALAQGAITWQETTEVPLMALVFLASMFHTRQLKRAADDMRELVHEELRRRERETDFLHDASHELRTRITVARGHAELLGMGGPPGRQAQDAAALLRELTTLSRVTDRLLELDQVTGPGALRRRPVDIGEMLSDTVQRWAGVARRSWVVRAQGSDVVHCDPDRLQTALDALIENAVDFTHDGDRISVGYRARGDTATVTVSDSGPGIAPEVLPHVFDRFFSSGPTDGRRGGTGLGLAIVRAIAEAHGGSVQVDSSPGKGATFVVRFPGGSTLDARPGPLDGEPHDHPLLPLHRGPVVRPVRVLARDAPVVVDQ